MKDVAVQANLKGVLFAFGNTLCISMVFIFSRIIQETMTGQVFLFWWFGFASIWALLILLKKRKELKVYVANIKNHPLFLIYFVISETLATFLFFFLVRMVNPSIISFLNSLTPFFVVIIAFFLINERLKKIELLGGAISIAGVIVITYVSPDIPLVYFLLTMVMVLLYAFNNVLVRKKVQDIPPLLITLLRIFSLFSLFAAYVFIKGGFRLPTLKEGLFLVAGSVSGPIVGLFMLFSALKYTRATTVSLIKSTQPFLVALLAAWVLNFRLSIEQLIGGSIIILGISLLLSEKKFHKLKKKIFRVTALALLILVPFMGTYWSAQLHGSESNPVGFLKDEPFPVCTVTFDPEDMLRQAREVLHYFKEFKNKDSHALSPGLFANLGVSVLDVTHTLEFVCRTIEEDLALGRESRLKDPVFLRHHFRVIRWYPFPAHGAKKDLIRITRYAVFTVPGELKRSEDYPYALYCLPDDEAGLSLEEAQIRSHELDRFRYTRQQVMAGAYLQGGAKPLVWLSARGLDEALMQGTICVKVKGYGLKYFNVNRNNGIPFNPATKKNLLQPRYWYFSQVDHPRGYGLDVESMVKIYPYTAFAGDLANLGLGKLAGLTYPVPVGGGRETRLGILADTGGAFRPNLNQLDCYTGVVESRNQLQIELTKMPEFTEVFFLINKNILFNNKRVPL